MIPNDVAFKMPEIVHCDILMALLDQIEPIDFAQKVNLKVGEKLSKKHYIITTIDEIRQLAINNNWGLAMSDGFVYSYNGAYWKQIERVELRNFLGTAAQKLGG